tara:strand:+ start:4760 stop:6727 length:1968 start_codon:yes stop_codon:yes gene_type:complete
MGFWDNPIIDRNAERSEVSVLQTRLRLSLENGFVSRVVDGSQDYGVDIYCELQICNEPSGFIFPIQIKSTYKAKYVVKKGEKYFTLPFQTSRLGYLLRHIQGPGMIIFYNETDKTLYYDYVQEIYNRIRLEKNDNVWKHNKFVTIHIPSKKILAEDLITIHNNLRNKFHNTKILIDTFEVEKNASLYTKEPPINNLPDINRIKDAIQLLETIGPYLFNKHEYAKITSLLELVPYRECRRHKLSYIAALTYAETGEFIEADYFLKHCFTNKELYSKEEFVALEMQRFKIDFSYGVYTPEQFISRLRRIKEQTSNQDNIVNIDILILKIEINQKIGRLDFEKNIINEIEDIFQKINTITQDEEQKSFQQVFLSENLIGVLTRIYSDHLHDKHLLSKNENFVAFREWETEYNHIISSFEKVLHTLDDSLQLAKSKENKLLEAHALNTLARGFFSMNLSLFMEKVNPQNHLEVKTILEGCLHQAVSAFNLFLSIEIYQLAFESIILAYDIYRLAQEWIDVDIDNIIPLSEIDKRISSFDKYEFGGHFKSTIDKIVNDHVDEAKNLDDDALLILAERILHVKNLPKHRVKNLFNELKAYRFYSTNCNRDDLVLLSNQEHKGKLAYSQPSKFAIASIKTGVIFIDGYNIESIMRTLGLLNE